MISVIVLISVCEEPMFHSSGHILVQHHPLFVVVADETRLIVVVLVDQSIRHEVGQARMEKCNFASVSIVFLFVSNEVTFFALKNK